MTKDERTIPGQQGQSANNGTTMPPSNHTRGGHRFRCGEMILRRYEVQEELGQGGMGIVYKCFDRLGRVTVALKTLPPELERDVAEMEAVIENYRRVARLSHQYIAGYRTLEQDESTGDYYLVMDYAEGRDLRLWMRENRGADGGVPLERALPVLREVAEALDYAHGQGIVHQDVKPVNLKIDGGGHIKLLDFGLAADIRLSLSRVSNHAGGTGGTPPYMSPEQWKGEEGSMDSDQYALGVMAYEMLAGHLPFENPDLAVLRQIVLEEKAAPVSFLPRSAQAALSRVLAKDPQERFCKCVDFVDALGGNTVAGALALDGSNAEAKLLAAAHPRDSESSFILDLKGNVSLELVKIPKGDFTMGSPSVEEKRNDDEAQHPVSITHDFWLGRTEVTQGQWKAIMGRSLREQANLTLDDDTVSPILDNKTPREFFGLEKGQGGELIFVENDSYPIYWVSWEEASEFCRRLTQAERQAGRLKEGYEYTLPTEAQWEYACRAGTESATYAGDLRILGDNNAPVLDRIAWYGGNSSDGYEGRGVDMHGWKDKQYPGGIGGPREVGLKESNAWGLHDMLGNVYEWCRDWYEEGYASDPEFLRGQKTGSFRVFRGGSWYYYAGLCRAAFRFYCSPSIRYNNLGFRLALVLVP